MNIILHEEYREIIDLLTPEERGCLLTALFDYAVDGTVDEMTVPVKMAFTVIRQRADRDAEKYEAARAAHAEAGRKGGRPKKEQNQAEPNETKKNQMVSEESKKSIPICIPIPISKDSIKERKDVVPEGTARFKKPTLEEVAEYCRERGNSISPQGFINYYDSNGWRVGKNPMKDWKAAVRTWEARDGKTVAKEKPKNGFHNFDQRKIDYDAILRAEMEAEAKAEGV